MQPLTPDGGPVETGPNSFESWLRSVFLGDDPAVRKVRAQIARAASSERPILISGETGTGKEIVSRAIHRGGSRKNGKLYVAALAGLGETAWSVLFGHKRGAFTGAVGDQDGLFGAAHGATLLFDDIDNIPIKLQAMLLRAVEQGTYLRLGDTLERRSDVRILATTNVSLEREIGAGRFRADLYQRLSVLRIELPPLRSHMEDLDVYVPHFLKKASSPELPPKEVSREAMDVLRSYPWPRNVRELENLLYRASVEVPGPMIGAEDLRKMLAAEDRAERSGPRNRGGSSGREAVEAVLRESGWNKREAARRLKMAPGTLYKLIERYHIYVPRRGVYETGRNVP